MADVRLSDLPALGELADEDLFEVTDMAPAPVSRKATAAQVLAHAPSAGGNKLCPHENLTAARASNSTVTIAADAVLLRDATSGRIKRFATLSETLDIANSGANGLDTGSEGSSRWYHLWAIGKEDGTLDGLLSESASAPTLPSGYTYKGYLGAVYNNGSSHFANFKQVGDIVVTDNTAAGTSLAGGPTALSLSALVPPGARAVHLRATMQTSAGTANGNVFIYSEGGFALTGALCFAFPGISTAGAEHSDWVPITTPQTVYYFTQGTNVQTNVSVEGWRF